MVFAHKNNDYNPNQLFIRSDWEPDKVNVPIELRALVSYFLKCLSAQFRRRPVLSNLPPFQKHLLTEFIEAEDHQVFPSDKNLGSCVIEKTDYILCPLKHLSDTTTYKQLSQANAESGILATGTLIKSHRVLS
jgi:hypothetical protein